MVLDIQSVLGEVATAWGPPRPWLECNRAAKVLSIELQTNYSSSYSLLFITITLCLLSYPVLRHISFPEYPQGTLSFVLKVAIVFTHSPQITIYLKGFRRRRRLVCRRRAPVVVNVSLRYPPLHSTQLYILWFIDSRLRVAALL